MSKKTISLILLLALTATAWGATDLHPLQWAEGSGGDPPNQVTVYVRDGADTNIVDVVALTRDDETEATATWYGSTTVTLGQYYTFNYVAVWASNDTVRWMTIEYVENPADYKSATAGGGAQTDSFFVYDTSGTDELVPDVDITVKPSGGGAAIAYGSQTDANGYLQYNLSASTEYLFQMRRIGYAFSDSTYTTDSGDSDSIAFLCYDLEYPAPSSATVCAVSGTLIDPEGNAIQGAEINLQLSLGQDSLAVHAGVAALVGILTQTTTTDDNGQWTLERIPNADITPEFTTYTYSAKKAGILIPGHYKDGVEVPDQANANIEDIL